MNQANKIGPPFPRRVVYLTAGAAGMYCGSCMYDNALAKALIQQQVDCLLVPVYTPIRVDGDDVSQSKVFFGGVNVYLDQILPFYGKLPSWVTGWLDNPWILRKLTGRAGGIDAASLGELTLSMLAGRDGRQRREVDGLIDWLSNDARPDIVVLTNLLIGGCIPDLQKRLQVPVVVMLQGDDLFLDFLPDSHRARCLEQLQTLGITVDRFVTHTEFYADKMSRLFEVPRPKFSVVPLGLDPRPYAPQAQPPRTNEPQRIGYLARLAPEKGLHLLVDAFIRLHQDVRFEKIELHVAGWLGEQNRTYAEQQWEKLRAAGLGDRFVYHGSPDQAAKRKFLSTIDLLSVPTTYQEPKGLFVLEAFAAGIPVVQPNHGAFPELIAALGGGRLFPVGEPIALADTLAAMLLDATGTREMGENARIALTAQRTIDQVAKKFLEMLRTLEKRF